MDHAFFDKRKYPIVGVREGYGEWVRTYEQTVYDEMDLRLLDRLRSVDWSAAATVLDLACGTGRIGTWLRSRTNAAIDGVDLTPEMLAVARSRNIYRTLAHADVTATGHPAETYDLCTQSLADEHLPDLRPLYAEVARVAKPGAAFVLVGFHPQFLMTGMPTHFNRGAGRTDHDPELCPPLKRPREGRPRRRLDPRRIRRRHHRRRLAAKETQVGGPRRRADQFCDGLAPGKE